MKKAIFTICLLVITTLSFAQYTLNLPSFINNPMLYNPAYAGNTEVLDASILHFRSDNFFTKIDNFNLLSVSSPIGKSNWSIGGNFMRERTYYLNLTSLDGIISYHKKLKNGNKLSFGGLASVEKHYISGFGVDAEKISDAVFMPQLGIGVMYQAKRGYISVSLPNTLLSHHSLEVENGEEYSVYTKNDFYISGGLNFETFNGALQILPSATLHRIIPITFSPNISSELELGTTFVLFQRIRLGGSCQLIIDNAELISNPSMNLSLGVNFKNGIRVSGKLGMPVGSLRNPLFQSQNSGIILGYRLSNDHENPYLGREMFF